MRTAHKTIVVPAEPQQRAAVMASSIGMLMIRWKVRPAAGQMVLVLVDGEPVDVARIAADCEMALPLPEGEHRLSGGFARDRKAAFAVNIAAGQKTAVDLVYHIWTGKVEFENETVAGPVQMDEAALSAALQRYFRIKKLASAAAAALRQSNAELQSFSDKRAVVFRPSWFVVLAGGLLGNTAQDALSKKYVFELEADGSITCRTVKKLSDVPRG